MCLPWLLIHPKVAWLRVEDKGILTIHDHVITRNYRINLIHTEEKQFTLLIKNIQPSDAGGYMCQVSLWLRGCSRKLFLLFFSSVWLILFSPQINTVPMKSRVGYVEVVVPPQILVNETSSDVVASEGSNVTLECRASGHPRPQIQWKREDRKDIPLQTPSGKKYVGLYTTFYWRQRFFSSSLHWLPLCLPASWSGSCLLSPNEEVLTQLLSTVISAKHQWRIFDNPSSGSSSHGSPFMYCFQWNSTLSLQEGFPQSPV